jgi:membrane associated rhomboid family serine protease
MGLEAMIFPFLFGAVSPLRAPITYLIIAMNLFVFLISYRQYSVAERELSVLMKDEDFLLTQGLIFASALKPKSVSSTASDISADASVGPAAVKSSPRARPAPWGASRILSRLFDAQPELTDPESSEKVLMLGYLAMRNEKFLAKAQEIVQASGATFGDRVAIESWKIKFQRVLQLQSVHPLYQMGLSSNHKKWYNYFTYQFVHSGWMHLMWNLLFLMIFGALIEIKLGSEWLIYTNLAGGIFGAVGYQLLSGISASPLVGASGAISALMAMTAVVFFRERLRFWFWLLPVTGFYGFVLLPAWVIFVFFCLPDVAGLIASVDELGFSVAHAAHIGGACIGIVSGLLARGLNPELSADFDPESQTP